MPLKYSVPLESIALKLNKEHRYSDRLLTQKFEHAFHVGSKNVFIEDDISGLFDKIRGIKLLLVRTGRISIIVNKQIHHLESEDFIVLSNFDDVSVLFKRSNSAKLIWLDLEMPLSPESKDWIWASWILLTEANLCELTKLLKSRIFHIIHSNTEALNVFEKLLKLETENRPELFSLSLIKTYINNLLITFCEAVQKNEFRRLSKPCVPELEVQQFLERLNQSLSYGWDLNSMARQCGLGRSSFSKYCKKISNRTPLEYLKFIRIRKAIQVLEQQPLLSIKDIADLCGFHTNQYFTKEFKKFTGSCPSEYRERIQCS